MEYQVSLIRIREFQEKDVKEIIRIFKAAFQEEIARGMRILSADNLVEFSKRLGVKIFVADKEGSVAGFLTLTEGDMERNAQIHMVAVAKPLRKKGVGTELIKKALEHVKMIERKKLKLFTRPWNVAIRKICANLGFLPEAYLRREFLDEDVILYSAFLS